MEWVEGNVEAFGLMLPLVMPKLFAVVCAKAPTETMVARRGIDRNLAKFLITEMD